VPGLRRAEVAMLAGVSPDYYMRLEQGRDRRPSTDVLDALARALLLDDETRPRLGRGTGRALAIVDTMLDGLPPDGTSGDAVTGTSLLLKGGLVDDAA
jgi:transcriptional regulator with XRE-family HTH domain